MSSMIVGRPLVGFGTIAEGSRFEPTMLGQPVVFFGLDSPTPEEVEAVQSGPIKMAIFRSDEHLSFLLAHMPGLNALDGWDDAPFSAMMSAPEDRQMRPREPEAGWAFIFVLVDTRTGILRALRTGTVSPVFSQIMEEVMTEQVANGAGFTRERHAQSIQSVYDRYPTPGLMARDAEIVEPFGVKFAEARERRTGRRFS